MKLAIDFVIQICYTYPKQKEKANAIRKPRQRY